MECSAHREGKADPKHNKAKDHNDQYCVQGNYIVPDDECIER